MDRKLGGIAVLFFACISASGPVKAGWFDRAEPCVDEVYSDQNLTTMTVEHDYGKLTVKACYEAKEKRRKDLEHAQAAANVAAKQRQDLEDEAARALRARQIAEARALAASGTVKVPPLLKRYEIYALIDRMTAQQIITFPKEEQHMIQCQQIAKMIDEELASERDGWQVPLYNLDSLRTYPGLPDCWAYFMSMK